MPILGTQPEAIHLAEDREEFSAVLTGAGLPAPRHGTASSFAEAREVAAEIGASSYLGVPDRNSAERQYARLEELGSHRDVFAELVRRPRERVGG